MIHKDRFNLNNHKSIKMRRGRFVGMEFDTAFRKIFLHPIGKGLGLWRGNGISSIVWSMNFTVLAAVPAVSHCFLTRTLWRLSQGKG
jgi:hypothetical protein